MNARRADQSWIERARAANFVTALTRTPMRAPHVNAADLDAAIKQTDYIVLPDGRTTICMLTLDNGFTVRGESSCVCLENFDPVVGRDMSLRAARDKLWPLLGFRLADNLMLGAHR